MCKCLIWPNRKRYRPVQWYAPNLTIKTTDLHLLKQFCFTIEFPGGTRIQAHRLVLCSASEYFSAMFTSDLLEARQTDVELHAVCGTALRELVEYCYTGSVELREDSVETLLSTASLLNLHQVVDACSIFLRRQLDPSNCIGIALFADSRCCTKLRDDAMEYIAVSYACSRVTLEATTIRNVILAGFPLAKDVELLF